MMPLLNMYISQAIFYRLKYFKGNQTKTAKSLGISRIMLRSYLPTELLTHNRKEYIKIIRRLNNLEFDVVTGLYIKESNRNIGVVSWD